MRENPILCRMTQCHLKCSYRWKRETDRGSDVKTEAASERCFIADFEDERRPYAKECGQPPEAEKGQESLQKERSPAMMAHFLAMSSWGRLPGKERLSDFKARVTASMPCPVSFSASQDCYLGRVKNLSLCVTSTHSLFSSNSYPSFPLVRERMTFTGTYGPRSLLSSLLVNLK